MTEKVTLQLTWADHADKNLTARVAEFKRRNQRVALDQRVETIQFLRGAAARASQILPAFYIHIGAHATVHDSSSAHWEVIRSASLDQYSLQSIALICRSIFDDSRKGMTGKRFANIGDDTLTSVAQYWSESAKCPVGDATSALLLLKELFGRCAQPSKMLIEQPSLLERRIGLLKFYADRQVAHISLDDYLFDVLDLTHVVAAIALIGAIIVDFDDPQRGQRYFDSLDQGGWDAAKQIYPSLSMERLFVRYPIHQQAALKWKIKQRNGVEFILNQLPAAIGFWDSRSSAQ